MRRAPIEHVARHKRSLTALAFEQEPVTQVAALFYTLCETAKLVGVDPHAYLLRALYTAMVQPGAITYPEALLISTPVS